MFEGHMSLFEAFKTIGTTPAPERRLKSKMVPSPPCIYLSRGPGEARWMVDVRAAAADVQMTFPKTVRFGTPPHTYLSALTTHETVRSDL
jgi:hypothetical protein